CATYIFYGRNNLWGVLEYGLDSW
nr:immunoglobulin heavy chain junction region [Macaca mulatta]MOW76781.1 immunoglobulin heavy chain junction region [Macaca mulatta]MOW81890.1 immunoglobulin heavy chain junction region [Macaca mulatta]MOW82164.1 immunoglobulin heavy chain junction region [Macaca mulatta]